MRKPLNLALALALTLTLALQAEARAVWLEAELEEMQRRLAAVAFEKETQVVRATYCGQP